MVGMRVLSARNIFIKKQNKCWAFLISKLFFLVWKHLYSLWWLNYFYTHFKAYLTVCTCLLYNVITVLQFYKFTAIKNSLWEIYKLGTFYKFGTFFLVRDIFTSSGHFYKFVNCKMTQSNRPRSHLSRHFNHTIGLQTSERHNEKLIS